MFGVKNMNPKKGLTGRIYIRKLTGKTFFYSEIDQLSETGYLL